ncbi:hypothetical protein M433DRAFT_254315 [Acidomyces richmondensis BFW]|nr:hypothetical protein M433DRAFT_254315 [Acidomyces richmondensis BFW]
MVGNRQSPHPIQLTNGQNRPELMFETAEDASGGQLHIVCGDGNSNIIPHGDGEYEGSETSSYMSSILSSVRRGVENGRLYPSFGKYDYDMPIDEAELDRNDLQHFKFTLLLDNRL